MYRNRIKRLLDIFLSACGILCRWDKDGLRTPRDVQEEKRPKTAEKKDRSLEEFMKW